MAAHPDDPYVDASTWPISGEQQAADMEDCKQLLCLQMNPRNF